MADPGFKCRQIGEGVNLYSEAIKGPPATYRYWIEPIGFHKITFTFNFEGSKNFELYETTASGDSHLQAVVTSNPFEKSSVVTCRQENIRKGGSLSMSMSWVLEEPDEEFCSKYKKQFESKISGVIHNAQRIFRTGLSGSEIQKLCGAHKLNFVDTSFPPIDESLYKTSESTSGGDASDADAGSKRKTIVWRRPSEFLEGEFQVFEDPIEPNDIKQGQLGDCWLMCSFASLAEFPNLVKYLFVNCDEVNPDGFYTIRICKNGMWQEMVIDDYFPCFPEGGPIYSRAHGNELWVLLLEKAFAKLNGSYAAIRSGWPFEAMMDLTGAPYKDIRFSEPSNLEKIRDGTLWQDLLKYDQQQYVMSLSTGGVDTFTESDGRSGSACGLVPGHAYTLISVVEVSTGDRLMKLRNPWGSMEWNGNWSDDSAKWTPELMAEVGFEKADDGIFWMSFDDVIHHFVGINVCLARHSSTSETLWNEERLPFDYTFSPKGLGVVDVPKYLLTIDNDCDDFFASIHQQDKRQVTAPEYIDIGVTLMRQLDDGSVEFVGSSGNSVERQNQLHVERLPSGTYIVIPTSTGCKVEQLKEEKERAGQAMTRAEFQRSAVLAIHSTSAFSIDPIRFNPDTYEMAMDLPAIHEGSEMDLFGDASVMLYTRKSAYAGVSYVAKNQTDSDAIVLTMDFSGSENIVSHRGKLVADIVIAPGHAKVLHHIAPGDDCKDWAVGWSCNARWVGDEELQELTEKETRDGF